ncbi:MAG: type II secretion system protein [Pirellulales bacterium]
MKRDVRRGYTIWELMIVVGLVSFLLMMSASTLTSLISAGRIATSSQRQARVEGRLFDQLRDDLRAASAAEVTGTAPGDGGAAQDGRGETLKLTSRSTGSVEFRCGASAVERWEVPPEGTPRRTETFTLELAVPKSWRIADDAGLRHVELELAPQSDFESRWISRQAIRPVRVTARSSGGRQ